MNKKIINVLKKLVSEKYSVDEARTVLEGLECTEEVLNELDYIEDNFEDNLILMNDYIEGLVENFENGNLNIIEKPSVKELESALKFIDEEKLLLKNMIII